MQGWDSKFNSHCRGGAATTTDRLRSTTDCWCFVFFSAREEAYLRSSPSAPAGYSLTAIASFCGLPNSDTNVTRTFPMIYGYEIGE